jgi:membrane protein
VRALVGALNLAYRETEKRSFVHRYGMALLLTGGAICVAFCIGVVLMSVPLVSHWLQPTQWLQRFAFYARWPVVALRFWISLLVCYRYGPSRARARWSWVSWGALLATGLWLSGTGVLSWYVASSRAYHQAYGAVGISVAERCCSGWTEELMVYVDCRLTGAVNAWRPQGIAGEQPAALCRA